jgi:uncharacterized protein
MRWHGFVLTEIFADDTIRDPMPHPRVIDSFEFARAGSSLRGVWPLEDFPRVRDSLHASTGSLRYEVRGIPEDRGYPALRVRLEGRLQLVCQRCLGALEHPLQIEVSLLLAATQAEIDTEPFEPEGPERIVAGKEMPVHDLIEDELLLAIPIAPRHERCVAEAAHGESGKHCPFAALRGLVGGPKH